MSEISLLEAQKKLVKSQKINNTNGLSNFNNEINNIKNKIKKEHFS